MKRIALLAALMLASSAHAQFDPVICARLDLVAEDVESFDPAIFGPGPRGDVYHLSLVNAGAIDVTSLELSLQGNFINAAAGGLLFKDDPELPMLGPNTVLDTFFVAKNPLFVDQIDSGGVLQAAFTTVGGGAIVPASGEAVVAVLTVPAGVGLDAGGWTGRVAISGQFQDVPFLAFCVPEPSALLLAASALALCGGGRRRAGDRHLRRHGQRG